MKKKKKTKLYLAAFLVLTLLAKYKLDKDLSNLEKEIKVKVEKIEDDYSIIAHRGFSSLEVENTSEAIVLASSKSYVDAIEVDARITKDGKIVISHSKNLYNGFLKITPISSLTFEEATGSTYTFYKFNAPDLLLTKENILIKNRQFKLNGRKYNVIGLPEGISCCKDKILLIDLKFENNIPEFTEEVKRELEGMDTSNLMFQSLDIEGIKYFQAHTGYNCQILIDSKEDFVHMKDFQNIGLRYNLVTYDLVHSLLSQGKNVSIWTINSMTILDDLIDELGDHYNDVSYITSCPDIIVVALKEKNNEKTLTNR